MSADNGAKCPNCEKGVIERIDGIYDFTNDETGKINCSKTKIRGICYVCGAVFGKYKGRTFFKIE